MSLTRSQQARARALGAAREVVAERGVAGFTVEAVTERSGVAKTTIYRHWDSANHLLLAAVDDAVEPVPTPNTGRLHADLVELYRYLDAVASEPANRTLMLDLLAASHRDPELGRLKDEMVAHRLQPLHTVIELAQLRGELPTEIDRELAVDVVEGVLFFRRIIRDRPTTAAEVERLATAAVAALGALGD